MVLIIGVAGHESEDIEEWDLGHAEAQTGEQGTEEEKIFGGPGPLGSEHIGVVRSGVGARVIWGNFLDGYALCGTEILGARSTQKRGVRTVLVVMLFVVRGGE